MNLNKYSREKIGLLIRLVRMEQGLERQQLCQAINMTSSRLFQIETGQSVLNEYEINLIFNELLLDINKLGNNDKYIDNFFEEYIDNYIFGLKKTI